MAKKDTWERCPGKGRTSSLSSCLSRDPSGVSRGRDADGSCPLRMFSHPSQASAAASSHPQLFFPAPPSHTRLSTEAGISWVPDQCELSSPTHSGTNQFPHLHVQFVLFSGPRQPIHCCFFGSSGSPRTDDLSRGWEKPGEIKRETGQRGKKGRERQTYGEAETQKACLLP